MRFRRDQLSAGTLVLRSEQVLRRLMGVKALTQARLLCTYLSHGTEPMTDPIVEWAWRVGKQVVVPRVEGEQLQLIAFDRWKTLRRGRFGIREPAVATGKTVPATQVDCFIVPGLAFDRQGFRMGYGKGYFDRLLAGVSGFKIGLCFAFQLTDALPHDPWDVPLSAVVTDKEIVDCTKHL
ncbi:MAG: 5-formyltetrahydrofolate cyclo-ligase [Firmicutes bacterium]|nr:5-formyltetrahydrofolate cyclo-ligase [Bacillota bacterium]